MTPGRLRDRPSRRAFLARSSALGAGAALGAGMAEGAWAQDSAETAAQRPSGDTGQDSGRGFPSIADFGAVGDGRSDDSVAVQAALDWAGARPGTRLRVPPRIFALGRPLLIPESIELAGEMPGAGNTPLCGFRALPGFASPYRLRYGVSGDVQQLGVSALLISQGWVDNAEFNQRLHLRDLFFDVDAQPDRSGGPIHGLMLANQQLDLHNVWVRSATGFGVWINTQRPDGRFMRPIVDNVLRRVWVRGAGIGGATFRTGSGVLRYGGFLIGALPGARDVDGRAEPPVATDGILDYCTVAVGPEPDLGCRGNGIHVTHSAGWRVVACHLNGAGRHGVVLDKAFQTELSGNYLDGWGVDADQEEGTVSCVRCHSMVSLEGEADGGLIIASNRIRARPVRSIRGNRFVALSVHAGAVPTPQAVLTGNVVVRRRDAAHPFAVYDFGRGGAGALEAVVVGNLASGARTTFLEGWNEAAVRPRFTANSFQNGTEPPAAGWHPTGLRIENSAPEPGGWSGWVNIRAGDPGSWRRFGQIEGTE